MPNVRIKHVAKHCVRFGHIILYSAYNVMRKSGGPIF